MPVGARAGEGIGGIGVVEALQLGRTDRSVGLLADVDTLPIEEQRERPYARRFPGVHHGCGHASSEP
jgi:metal-dependent amidase/aminoacylase/carboxypeptidase family protein